MCLASDSGIRYDDCRNRPVQVQNGRGGLMTELDQQLGGIGPESPIEEGSIDESGFSRRDFVTRGAGALVGASAFGAMLSYGARAATLGPAAAARSLANISVLD